MTTSVKATKKAMLLMDQLKALSNAPEGHFVIGYFPSKDLLLIGDRKIDRLLTVVKEASQIPDLNFHIDEKQDSLNIESESIGLNLTIGNASKSISVLPDSPSGTFASSKSFIRKVALRNKEVLWWNYARQLNAWSW